MKLYGYWRSSASFRVRIALALKGLDYDYEPVNLLKGEQRGADFRKRNPMALVPALVTDDGAVVAQSLAIVEHLEGAYPEPSILPGDAIARAQARAIAATIACEAQPFLNLRVQSYLKEEKGFDADALADWGARWTGGAMEAVEQMVAETAGDYCVGDAPCLADCYLVPQMFAAARFGVDVSGLSRMNEIYERCLKHPAFEKAHPLNQPDAVKN